MNVLLERAAAAIPTATPRARSASSTRPAPSRPTTPSHGTGAPSLAYKTQDYPGAIAAIQEALKREPRHFGALVGLGLIYEELGQERAALEAYRAALAIHPTTRSRSRGAPARTARRRPRRLISLLDVLGGARRRDLARAFSIWRATRRAYVTKPTNAGRRSGVSSSDRASLHVVERGPKDAPRVLLIHGASANLRELWTPAGGVLDTDHRVIAFDRPGYGHSTRPRRAPRLQTQAKLAAACWKTPAARRLSSAHSLGAVSRSGLRSIGRSWCEASFCSRRRAIPKVQHDRDNASPAFCTTPDEVHDFIDFAVAHYNVDPSRVYLTGLSLGAFGIWEYLAKYQGELQAAAAVPIAGDGRPGSAPSYCGLGSTPIWAFHGAFDDVVDPLGSIELMTALAECPGVPAEEAKLTVYPDRDHNSWDPAYAGAYGDDIYAWMLGFSHP